MQTFRRLNDPERYYGLSLRGWLALAVGVGLLYVAVRLSPFPAKPTISITLVLLTLVGGLLLGLSGQAIGPGRFLLTAVRHAASRKELTAPRRADRLGLTLSTPPPAVPAAESERGDVFGEVAS